MTNFKAHKQDHVTKSLQQNFIFIKYISIYHGVLLFYNTVLKLQPEPPAHSFELLWARPKLLLGQHLGLGLAWLPALSQAGHITILKLSKHTQ